MATPNWGLLTKSLVDNETIEDAVDRLITVHEEDPTAHLGAGESLEAHKTEDMIDHPAGSVATDKLSQGRVIVSAFESLDGFGTTGSVSQDLGSVSIITGATSGNSAEMDASPSRWTGLDLTKEIFWKSVLQLEVDTSQTAYFGMGGSDYLGQTGGMGFRVINGALVAYTAKDSGGGYVYTTEAIAGVDVTDWHTYEIRYTVTPNLLTFYVDGVDVASFDTGLDFGPQDTIALYEITTNTNAIRRLFVSDLVFQIER